MHKKGIWKFLLPYIIILGVIVVLFIVVGNGSTQAVNIEAQGYKMICTPKCINFGVHIKSVGFLF